MFLLRRRCSSIKQFRSVIRHFSTPKLTDHDIETYQQDGVVCLRGVFDDKWVKMAHEGVKKNLQNPSEYCDWIVDEKGKGLFFNDYYNYEKITEFHEYVTKSPAAELAGRLMKSTNAVLFHEHVFFKEKGSGKETPWHHDFTYYPLEGFQNCSLWMPTSHVRKQSCVKFIRGSHLWSKCFIPVKFESESNYSVVDQTLMDGMCDIKEFLCDVQEGDVLQWDVQPGDCIAFHMKCVHGTEASVNPEDRVVMATRWLGDDMIYARRPWEASPPTQLLPTDLKIGDRIAENNGFLIPWKK